MTLGDKLGVGIGGALKEITTTRTEKLNAIGTGHELDAIPISAVFTGLMVMAVFYWGTNQFIIQRALGAANLKEGQKGLLLAGFFKMLIPFMAMFPGLIAFHLFGPRFGTQRHGLPGPNRNRFAQTAIRPIYRRPAWSSILDLQFIAQFRGDYVRLRPLQADLPQ